jgi:hypothetical protein
MTAAPFAPARRSGGLTPRGLAVALTYRIRQVIETLPPTEAAVLLGELRELVRTYCPRSPRSLA